MYIQWYLTRGVVGTWLSANRAWCQLHIPHEMVGVLAGPNYLPLPDKQAVADCPPDGIHGSQILEALDFHLGFWRVVAVNLAFLFGFHLLAAAGLKLLQKRIIRK